MTEVDPLSFASLSAIAEQARVHNLTADAWMNLDNVDRQMIVTAALPGIKGPIDPRIWTYVVRFVADRLRVHVCLGSFPCDECATNEPPAPKVTSRDRFGNRTKTW